MCFFDFDSGVSGFLRESMVACGVSGYFTQGIPDGGSSSRLGIGQTALCDNIDTSDYMDIHEVKLGDQGKCINVTALKEGVGADNPFDTNEALLDNCALYDVCPADGISGGPRNPISPDVIDCDPGSPKAETGEFPGRARADLAGNPYRWTLPKFVCFEYPAGLSRIDVTYTVSSSRGGDTSGRNFLFTGLSAPEKCVDAETKP
jgi:hypothetical protein